jgi:AmmeMemoRadiSam system protein B
MLDFPKLRNGLQAIPIEQQGQRLILLRDSLGYAPDSLLIPMKLAVILMQMNGENSLRDLQAHYVRMTGNLLYMENLEDMVKKLDENLCLDNERFRRLLVREINEFREDPIRRMQHAGNSYPVDPSLLRFKLDGFFTGLPGYQRAESKSGNQLVALMAPHIDLNAGGVCFAHAYQAASAANPPATWVVLGTGHEPVENYFALTLKDFETPLGLMLCDQDYGSKLLRRSPRDILAGEYHHRKEHTIEFQALFLAHSQPSSRIVPLLCSFGLEEWEVDRFYIDEMAGLIRNLALEKGPAAVGFIASVDLAHIGPRYGDPFSPNAGTVQEHLHADAELLRSLGKCSARDFMQLISRERNRRRVCGMAPLYVLAKILEGLAEGEILEHTHAIVDHQNSFVTFASMAFYAQS